MRPAALSLLALAALAACGSPPATTHRASPTPLPTPAATPVPTLPPTPTPLPALNAPAIVQVENSPEGRPQSGLGKADIVYEYVAEGGVGRFSVMFFNLPPADQLVGPVRSARTVTVQLLDIYQGFLAYSGSDLFIHRLLKQSPQPSFNETSAEGNLFRVPWRYPPHNLYTNGSYLSTIAAMAKQPPVSYQLWPRVSPATGGTPITAFTADISASEQPHFTWVPQYGGFIRGEDTGMVKDPATGNPLVLPTVIVQQVAVTTDPNVIDVVGEYGVDQAITGTGSAEVFTGGQEFKATWTQPAHGPPTYTLADGSPAPIAPGEVWICLVPLNAPAVVG